MSVSAFLPTTIVVETLEDQEIDSLQQPPSSRLLRLLPLLFDEFYVVQGHFDQKVHDRRQEAHCHDSDNREPIRHRL